ncbi:ATP-binding cassette domain-containing protein [Desulfovibrio sp. JY]|nr:ATP-binding cassette domain-containing protein [Desulfovibrio sp. JY]
MTLLARLTKKLPHFTLDVELSCPPGGILVLTGPSGSGKTTILRLLAGLDDPDKGRVGLDGEIWRDTAKGIRVKPRRRGIGLVFQEYSLFPHMSLAENVAYATKDTAFADELLELFGIAHLKDAHPGTMSGGERQRGALCQALARRPKALLLDEPFSALDAATRVTLRHELLDVRQRFAIPIVHVTHDLAEAAILGDQVVTINRGTIDPDWFTTQLCQYRQEREALFARFGAASPVMAAPPPNPQHCCEEGM